MWSVILVCSWKVLLCLCTMRDETDELGETKVEEGLLACADCAGGLNDLLRLIFNCNLLALSPDSLEVTVRQPTVNGAFSVVHISQYILLLP